MLLDLHKIYMLKHNSFMYVSKCVNQIIMFERRNEHDSKSTCLLEECRN